MEKQSASAQTCELYLRSRHLKVGQSFLFDGDEYLITKRTQEKNETRTTFIIKQKGKRL